jgi:Arc/MetJ-type ribon-helix-helix transcriptional regulator
VNTKDTAGFFERIEEELERWGIQLESLSCDDLTPDCMKIVCMPAGLRESLNEMGKRPRGNVVMVRVDDPTITKLDNWVETGAVKTRSEAAALFIREGLKVREQELTDLEGALHRVDDAKDELRRRAREVFGTEEPKGDQQ